MPSFRPIRLTRPAPKPVFQPYYGLVKPQQPLFNIGGTDYRQITPKRPMVIRKGYAVKRCFYYNDLKSCMGTQCYWPKVGSCTIYDKLYSKTKAGRIAGIKIKRLKFIRAKKAARRKNAWRAAKGPAAKGGQSSFRRQSRQVK